MARLATLDGVRDSGLFVIAPLARLAKWYRELSLYLHVYYPHTSAPAYG
jgi:hypothetical protein